MNALHPAECLPPDMLQGELEPLPEQTSDEPVHNAPQADTLLSLHQVAVRVGSRRIGPFTLDVQPGERIAVLGPSGAGKSTLLKLAAGDRLGHEGRVLLAAKPIDQWSALQLAQRRAMLPQAHSTAFAMSVELVVGLGRCAFNIDPHRDQIVADALATAAAGHLRQRRIDTLSGGELARVHLARVLAQLWQVHGALLLVDEPLAALDPGLQFEILDVLVSFARERRTALVCVLHDINLALRGFDRLWLVDGGELVADVGADPAAVPLLEQLFGIRLRSVVSDEGCLAVVASRAQPSRLRA